MAKIKLVVSANIEETFSDFIISKKTKGLAEKALQSYPAQFQAVARHLDAMIISMRTAHLSPNSINSYTRTHKSFFFWCNAIQALSQVKQLHTPNRDGCPGWGYF